MTDHKEAEITINGAFLSQGQAATVRVALESFVCEIAAQGDRQVYWDRILGEDKRGAEMRKAYLARLEEIRKLMSR